MCVYDDVLFITILSMAKGKDEFVYFDEIKKFSFSLCDYYAHYKPCIFFKE
jgi:hypothetical protein